MHRLRRRAQRSEVENGAPKFVYDRCKRVFWVRPENGQGPQLSRSRVKPQEFIFYFGHWPITPFQVIHDRNLHFISKNYFSGENPAPSRPPARMPLARSGALFKNKDTPMIASYAFHVVRSPKNILIRELADKTKSPMTAENFRPYGLIEALIKVGESHGLTIVSTQNKKRQFGGFYFTDSIDFHRNPYANIVGPRIAKIFENNLESINPNSIDHSAEKASFVYRNIGSLKYVQRFFRSLCSAFSSVSASSQKNALPNKNAEPDYSAPDSNNCGEKI
jgi:hypothetical protein